MLTGQSVLKASERREKPRVSWSGAAALPSSSADREGGSKMASVTEES